MQHKPLLSWIGSGRSSKSYCFHKPPWRTHLLFTFIVFTWKDVSIACSTNIHVQSDAQGRLSELPARGCFDVHFHTFPIHIWKWSSILKVHVEVVVRWYLVYTMKREANGLHPDSAKLILPKSHYSILFAWPLTYIVQNTLPIISMAKLYNWGRFPISNINYFIMSLAGMCLLHSLMVEGWLNLRQRHEILWKLVWLWLTNLEYQRLILYTAIVCIL